MDNRKIKANQAYNREREAQAEWLKCDLERDKILARLYQASYDRMQGQIDQFYLNYASKNGLNRQEVQKRVDQLDVASFNDRAAKAVKERDFSPATNDWLSLYNLKMKVSRLELLKAELALEIQNLTAEVDEVFDKARHDEFLGEYKRQAGILGNSATGVTKRLEAILGADFYGQSFSVRVWGKAGLQASLQRDLFGSLNRIYTDMMGYKKERDRLAKKFGTNKTNAQRLLKTELARIRADTQLAMLKENDFTHLIYVAEPSACDLCGSLDKLAIPIEQVEKGVNMYPMHPNCRCSAYGHIKMDYKAGGSTLDREAPNGVWGNKILEKELEKAYNQGIKSSGAVYGAWNDRNDPYSKERDRHAEIYYEQVRNRDKTLEIARVARNSGFSESDIGKIYNHIFMNEYELYGGVKRFDPSYDMAESWRRLSESGGKFIQKHDIVMLNHELMEYHLMMEGLSYNEAHKETDKKYNYYEALKKWQIERGDLL